MSTIFNNFKVEFPHQDVFEESEKFFNALRDDVNFYKKIAADLHPGAQQLGPRFTLHPGNRLTALSYEPNHDLLHLQARKGLIPTTDPAYIPTKSTI